MRNLVTWFKYFSFSTRNTWGRFHPAPHIFQMGGNYPPTRKFILKFLRFLDVFVVVCGRRVWLFFNPLNLWSFRIFERQLKSKSEQRQGFWRIQVQTRFFFLKWVFRCIKIGVKKLGNFWVRKITFSFWDFLVGLHYSGHCWNGGGFAQRYF